MKEDYWDNQLDSLSKTRGLYYNDDYLEFLVKSVWKIYSPVRIIDFGCGFGFLGLKLLPLLPEGSMYTGVDAGKELINRGKEIFNNLPYNTEFILGDIQKMDLARKHDIAICHAFLLHMPNPVDILKKMIGSVFDNGRIICFEPHWISSMSNYHINGYDQSSIIKLGLLQELFENDAKREGKDGNIGLKIPMYLSQLGVKDIECRVSDKVNFLDTNGDKNLMNKLYDSLKEDGIGTDPGDRETTIKKLIERGMSRKEAVDQYDAEELFSNILCENSSLTCAPNMKITFGTVVE